MEQPPTTIPRHKAQPSQNWPKITTYDHVHQIFITSCTWFRCGVLCDRGLRKCSSGGRFNIKMSYRYRNSHDKNETVSSSSLSWESFYCKAGFFVLNCPTSYCLWHPSHLTLKDRCCETQFFLYHSAVSPWVYHLHNSFIHKEDLQRQIRHEGTFIKWDLLHNKTHTVIVWICLNHHIVRS